MEQIPLPPAPALKKTIMDVFTSPAEAFDGLKESASSAALWVVPLIVTICILIASVVTLYTNNSLKVEMREMQSKAFQQRVVEGKMTAEQAEQIESRMDSMGSGMMIAFGIIGGTIGMAIFFFGGALLLWLADKSILKAAAGYGKHLELFGIASWIGVLGSIVTIIMMAGLGTMGATPSAALAVFGSYDASLTMHKILSAINIFTIWEAIVAGFGLSKLSGKSTGAGISVSFLVFVLMTLISFALGFAR
ncbi:MAG TPA: hypothetical protein VMU30_06980 [Bacteroidota bacterium]|nr:hypothetical protein [Bacteroidota bacterium]